MYVQGQNHFKMKIPKNIFDSNYREKGLSL